ncbi:hypothetical protein PSET11_00249 [Arthrobacter ulcerisalmonis]|uniref:Uncharacterized protein n=1 Tax=Arthrobacter ulcerisalmonis TaxID=2483813 RepID=A0A3P5WR11_9MICC|nr:hypothetical protein [Arthrobacter ulcerisalmonis]VDC18383.1 hypothetical protein PSET11_00249 [Arthrobacter ulcerisalmonis]
MELTGTIEALDGSQDHITADGATYEGALASLRQRSPDGHRLFVIRTN